MPVHLAATINRTLQRGGMGRVAIMTACLVLSLCGSDAAAQTARPGDHELAPISGLPITVGDNLSKVKARLNISQDPEPTVSEDNMTTAQLRLPARGIILFFDDNRNITLIRLQRPFGDAVAGVRVGQDLAGLEQTRGPADRVNTIAGRTSYFYRSGPVLVRYDISGERKVDAIYIMSSAQRPMQPPLPPLRQPDRDGVPVIKVEGLPVAMGDKLSKVKDAFRITADPVREAWPTARVAMMLTIPDHGIILGFDTNEEITLINLGPQFSGSVGGIKVRQKFRDVQKALGAPDRVLETGQHSRIYIYKTDAYSVEYYVELDQRVGNIILR